MSSTTCSSVRTAVTGSDGSRSRIRAWTIVASDIGSGSVRKEIVSDRSMPTTFSLSMLSGSWTHGWNVWGTVSELVAPV